MAKRPTNCTWCARELDPEERQSPEKSEAGEVICDSCYDQEYRDYCTRCEEKFDKTELSPKPGRLIGVWRDAPALGRGDILAGYYRVLRWPIFADGMIEGYFFRDALQRVGPLDMAGLRSAEEEQSMAGPMCEECQQKATRSALLARCLVGEQSLYVIERRENMISEEQMERAEKEFAANAGAALSVARDAERALESYTYSGYRTYDPLKRAELLKEYQVAPTTWPESRAWILNLIRSNRK